YDSADSQRLIAHILKEATLPGASRLKASQVLHAISRVKDEMLGPEVMESSSNWELRAMAPVYREYQRLLKEANAMDFDDLLGCNYRSTQNILTAANALIENNRLRKPKNLWTDLGAGDLIGHYLATDEHDEAAFVAVEVLRLQETDGYRLSDIAVFYRTNAQSRVVEEVFTRFGIPYRVLGGLRFYERKEVKDVLAYLRVVVNTADSASLRRIINTPKRGIGDRTVSMLDAHAALQGITLSEAIEDAVNGAIEGISGRAFRGLQEFLDLIRGLQEFLRRGGSIGQVIEVAYDRSGYMAELESERSIEALGRVENLKELVTAAGQYGG